MATEGVGENLWEGLARRDPYWAACTRGRRHVQWQLRDFLATGEREVHWALQAAMRRQIYSGRRFLAIDFGCGPGRLIGPLAESFDRVAGIDISATMRDLARRTYPRENVSFEESTASIDPENVDLIYSTFVLQHLPGGQLTNYFREFSRILHPDGLLIFQLPSRPRFTLLGFAFLLVPSVILNFVQRHVIAYPGIMPMSWMRPRSVVRLVEMAGLYVHAVESGPRYSPNWKDVWYFCRKQPPPATEGN
jgi:SAM-dependent methyltransferase